MLFVFLIGLLKQSKSLKTIKEPQATPSVLPISIRSNKMKKEGDVTCTNNNCPDINKDINNYQPDSANTYQCGETCTATSGSFEYSFKGVKFGIYGVYSTENGKFDISVDGNKVSEVDSNRASNEKYSLLYLSNDLKYGEHTVKIQGQGNKRFQLYKLIFWPSLNAKRLNITELNRTGTWTFQSDLVGGVRGYAEKDSTTDTATAMIRFSKLWVYGTICQWHQIFDLDINSFNAKINPNDPKSNTDDLRDDSALLYESPELSPSDGLKFTIAQTATINYIYYIEEPSPLPTPSVLPISIRSAKMTRTGDVKCGSNNCPNLDKKLENYHPDAENTFECGEICTATTGSFEYKFKGEKFGLYGDYSLDNGKFDILLDGRRLSEIESG